MPQQHLENLITRLHGTFGDTNTSPQQQQLLDDLRNHLDGKPVSSDKLSLKDSANLLLEELEIDHPQAAGILREIVETLGRLGI